MRRKLTWALALLAAAAAAPPAASLERPETVRLVAVALDSRFVDLDDNAAISVGDVFTGTDALHAWTGSRRGPRVGRGEFHCTIVKARPFRAQAGQCTLTAFLADGQILAAGYVDFRPVTYTIPVLGGTGRFEDAGGTLSVRTLGRETAGVAALVFRLVP